jgi:solute carrier family 38 (sodium-coupled neutral amino acid transporter), member 9
MFAYNDIPAFVLRFSIFFMLISTYPLINLFLKNMILNLFYRGKEKSRVCDVFLNVLLILIPLLFALFYPAIGSVLAYVSAISGFLIIYALPVLAYLKTIKDKIGK